MTPSPGDIKITQRIKEISEMMGIILYDHIIFSENDHHSIIKKLHFLLVYILALIL
ncbi:JAB domain-containing protein [Staphylococcus aureus]|uniref:JAB domain-containing protein n=1 Tax=Staphylococcus aureus TaxID=1280 RepID=UPI002812813F|nr:JAB domain-containing protein [Staphylococcus aureus]